MRAVVLENSRALHRRGIEKPLQFLNRVRRAHGIAVELVHQSLIMAPVPPDVEGIREAARPSQIAEQDRAFRFREARNFRQQFLRLGEMVQHGIAHHQVKASIAKRNLISIGHIEMNASRNIRSRRETRNALRDHVG